MLRSVGGSGAPARRTSRWSPDGLRACDRSAAPSSQLCFGIAFCLGLLPAAAHGATFRISPTADITESYTDNVLAVSEGAEADFYTNTRAGADLSAVGARLNLNLSINAIHDYYLDTDGLNGIRPQALGTGEVELFQDHFFIDSSVSISEVSTQRSGARSATDRPLPSNRTQLLLYDVSPRLVNRLGRYIESTLQYSHSESRYSKPASGVSSAQPQLFRANEPRGFLAQNPQLNGSRSQKSDDVSLTLDTADRLSRISSQLEFSSSTSKSGIGNKLTEDRVDLKNEYQINQEIALIARVGYEDIGSGDPSLGGRGNSSLGGSGMTGALGFHVKPGPRLDFSTEYGRRFGEKNISADLNYKISAFYVLNASFSQSVQTQTSSRLGQLNRLIVGPDGRLVDPFTGNARDPGFSNFDISNGAFREDLFQLGLTGQRRRNSFSLGVDLSSRESGGNADKEDQLDVHLDLTRRMRPRLTGNLGFDFSDTLNGGGSTTAVPARASRSGNGDTQYQSDASLSYQLGASVSSNLSYSYFKRKSDIGGDIAENIVSVGVSAAF